MKRITVAVGTTIADRPPRRSVRARLRIRLLLWMNGGETCCWPHTVQSLGHALPALCRTHVGWNDVLLSPCPSLPSLRRRLLPFVVRLVHGCRVGGGALARWPPSAAQTARTVFPYAAFTKTRHYEMREKELTPPSSQAHCASPKGRTLAKSMTWHKARFGLFR